MSIVYRGKVQVMVEASSEANPDSLTTLHIITHLDWERENRHTFDQQRARLLDTLASLVEHMQTADLSSRLTHFLLGGQTIILDDVASIRSTLLTSLVIYNAGGRLGVGPWYILTDGVLTSGEALVRNLLTGRDDAERHGVTIMPVAYLSTVTQHSAQLPQILNGFGIDAAFAYTDMPVIPLPFCWKAPDNSSLLMMIYQAADDPAAAVRDQQRSQPDGPFIWLDSIQTGDFTLMRHLDNIDIAANQSSLERYAADLRAALPDALRPRVEGEVHLQRNLQTSGRFSARMTLKQSTAHLEAQLLHGAEPFLALALAYGTVRHKENARSLLDYSWRLLLQNHSRSTAAGAISDEGYQETEIRSRRIADNSQRVILAALDGLDGTRTNPQATAAAPPRSAPPPDTYITVWNPHGYRVAQVVELQLNLPPGLHPAVLVTPRGDERAFHWEPQTRTLGFRADVPPVGYRVYTLQLSRDATAAYNQHRIVAGRAIGSASGQSMGVNNGRVEWSLDDMFIRDLLTYKDGGDAGDIWQYQKPQPDIIMEGNIVDVVRVEATPTYERLLFRSRMRIAPGLDDGISRSRGLRVLDIMTSITSYHDVPGMYVRTEFTNSAEDHRLRAHIRTGIPADALYTDGAYALLKRPVHKDGTAGTQPMNSLTALYGDDYGIGLFTRGLPEFEPLYEDDQTTLALTLLRAVGWLDKDKGIATPGAQMQGAHTSEFMLMPLPSRRDPVHLMRQSQAYRAPLRAIQYDERPPAVAQSYLQLNSDRVVMTALKPPRKGDGLLVRLLNPSQADVGVHLAPLKSVKNAVRLNLAEEKQAELLIENNRVNISLQPFEIVTVWLGF